MTKTSFILNKKEGLIFGLLLLVTIISFFFIIFRLSRITLDNETAVYSVDLIAFYTAAKLIQEDRGREIYVPIKNDFGLVTSGPFYETARASGFKTGPTRFVYLPIFSAPFRIFTHQKFYASARLWLMLNLVFTAGVIFLQWHSCKGMFNPATGVMLVVALNLLCFPLFYGLKLGQTTIIVYLAVCLIYWLTLRGNDITAGIILGVIVALKYSPILFVLYFLYRKRYLLAISCFITVVSLILLSVFLYGLPLHMSYWQFFLQLAGMEIAGWSNQSLDAFFIRQFGGNNGLDFSAIETSANLSLLRNAVSCIMALFVFFSLRKGAAKTSQLHYCLEFSAMVLCFLLLPLISWVHYFVLAVLPVVIIIGFCLKTDHRIPKTKLICLTIVGYGMIALHLDYYRLMAVFGQNFFIKLIVSFPFLGACLLLLINLWLILKTTQPVSNSAAFEDHIAIH
jgi:hypothetical protein